MSRTYLDVWFSFLRLEDACHRSLIFSTGTVLSGFWSLFDFFSPPFCCRCLSSLWACSGACGVSPRDRKRHNVSSCQCLCWFHFSHCDHTFPLPPCFLVPSQELFGILKSTERLPGLLPLRTLAADTPSLFGTAAGRRTTFFSLRRLF